MFTITKIGANNFSHFDGFKTMNFSNWEIIFNYTTNTIILQMLNGAPFPKIDVPANEVIIKNGIDGTPETFSNTEQIRTRLLELNYNPLQSSVVGSAEWGSIGGDINDQLDLKAKLDEKINVDTSELEEKTTLVDNDVVIIGDSEDDNKAKKSTWLNIKNFFANLFILRSGTTAGNPITGSLESVVPLTLEYNTHFTTDLSNESKAQIVTKDDGTPGLLLDSGTGLQKVFLSYQGYLYIDDINNKSLIFNFDTNTGRFIIGSNGATNPIGLSGFDDFTPNITDFDYTQKIYVDTKLAKDSGATYDTNAIKTVTQAEYDAIGTPDATTLYFIV